MAVEYTIKHFEIYSQCWKFNDIDVGRLPDDAEALTTHLRAAAVQVQRGAALDLLLGDDGERPGAVLVLHTHWGQSDWQALLVAQQLYTPFCLFVCVFVCLFVCICYV